MFPKVPALNRKKHFHTNDNINQQLNWPAKSYFLDIPETEVNNSNAETSGSDSPPTTEASNFTPTKTPIQFDIGPSTVVDKTAADLLGNEGAAETCLPSAQ